VTTSTIVHGGETMATSNEPARRGLKERIENHPIIVILTAVALTAGLTSGPLEYWRSSQKSQTAAEEQRLKNQYETQIENLKQSLRGIPIIVGRKRLDLDVTSLTLHEGDSGKVTSRDEFIQPASFYALRTAALPGWSRLTMNELQFNLMTTGATRANLKSVMGPRAVQLSAKIPLYLWRQANAKLVITGVPGIHILYPQIIVELIKQSVVPALFADDTGTTSHAQNANGLEQFYKAEPTGFYLLSQLNLLAGSGLPVGLTAIQKKGNALYARIDTDLQNVSVNGRRYSSYHLAEQLILLGSPDGLYFVKTFLPSAGPFSPAEDTVMQWLSNFHIVITGT